VSRVSAFHSYRLTIDRGSHELVTIYVGVKKEGEGEGDRKKFVIHKNFACHYSPVLKKAFTGGLAESRTQTMVLEDIEEQVFALFVNWIYTQEVVHEDGQSPGAKLLIKLWVLAQKLLVPELQNQMIEAIEKRRKADNIIHTGMLEYVYKQTIIGSPLRRLLVDQYAYGTKGGHLLSKSGQFSKECLIDIVEVLVTIRDNGKKRPDTKNYLVALDTQQKK
jgi:hypothetical protein